MDLRPESALKGHEVPHGPYGPFTSIPFVTVGGICKQTQRKFGPLRGWTDCTDRKEGRTEGRKDERKDGRMEGRRDGQKEGRKDGGFEKHANSMRDHTT